MHISLKFKIALKTHSEFKEGMPKQLQGKQKEGEGVTGLPP